MNVILIGYRCTGKTSVGRRLAERLDLPFYDTDEMIRQRTGKTVQEIVETAGWPAFRVEERAVVRRLGQERESVIALGGGAVLDPDNVAALRENGCFVWLTADEETIMERMTEDERSTDQRPSLTSGDSASEVPKVLSERAPIYGAAADIVFDTTNGDPGKTVEEICKYLTRG